jgi:hypothetical protein
MQDHAGPQAHWRRWTITVALVASLLAAAGVVAFFALRQDDDGPLDPADPHPWLTMRFWPYSIADYWQPSDLPNMAVYPDGTVLRLRLEPTGSGGDVRLVAERFPIPRSTADALYRQVVEADLTGGGVQPMVQIPRPGSVADGGRTAFTSTLDGVTTTRVLDQGGLGGEGDAVRERFEELQSALTPFLQASPTDLAEVPITSWAILAEPVGDQRPYDGQVWTGPDLDTLAWTPIDGIDCAIVKRVDWPLPIGERQVPSLVVDGRIVTRRPLLPGTTSCAEVVATALALEPARMQRSVEPG